VVTIQFGKQNEKGPAQFLARVVTLGFVVWVVYLAPLRENWAMWMAAAGWIAFGAYWSAVARNAAEAKSAEPAESRRVHSRLVNIGLLLLFVPVWGLEQSFLSESPVWALAGLALEGAALGLAVWARRRLGRNWSGRIEIKQGHELVRTGPYRVLRHPIYTAIIGMTVATAMVDGRIHALLGVALVAAAYWRKIRIEEAKLGEAFGGEWEEYRRGTWAMVPGVF